MRCLTSGHHRFAAHITRHTNPTAASHATGPRREILRTIIIFQTRGARAGQARSRRQYNYRMFCCSRCARTALLGQLSVPKTRSNIDTTSRPALEQSKVFACPRLRIENCDVRSLVSRRCGVRTGARLLYWDIGRLILERQQNSGWGAKIIDRLSGDLRDAYPDMKGFSPRNLKYMRAFSAAWPDRAIVQVPLAQITWYHNIALLEKVSAQADRLWYARHPAFPD